MLRPPRLRPGDRVAVVAPAGPVPREGLAAGIARLAGRYTLTHDEGLYTRTGFLAGSDERRAQELQSALDDASVRALWCARGGYGITRILPSLRLHARKLVIGFSDVTALHGALATSGLVSVHGPVLTQLGVISDDDVAWLLALLEDPAPPAPWTGLIPVAPGRATGPLVGGNLEVLTRLVGTPFLPPLDGALLALEEVGERPYRLDRQLTHLAQAGILGRVAGVVVGDLIACEGKAGEITPSADEVVRERLERLGIPVVAGAPFGHARRHRAFAHGARATLDADAGTLTFLDGAVD